jgi:amino acid transporter
VENPSVIGGDLGHFLALFTTMRIIFFAMLGFEIVAITAPENKNLETEETLKLASRKIVLRISVLYIMAVFTVGLNVPYNDAYLQDLNINSFPAGQNSIFVLSAVQSGLRGWPHFFNGFFIFSAASSGISTLYCASRILHALAGIPEAWPLWGQSLRRRLERTNSVGVPISTIVVSWLFGLLAFLSTKGSAATVG